VNNHHGAPDETRVVVVLNDGSNQMDNFRSKFEEKWKKYYGCFDLLTVYFAQF
jgi:hypothetical protein